MPEMSRQLDQPVTCPWCHMLNDGLTCATRDETPMPQNGDVTICLHCGKVSLFEYHDDGLTQRKPTEAETERLAQDQELRSVILAWHNQIGQYRSN